MTFDELLNEYVKFLEVDLLRSKRTVKTHVTCLKNFQRFLNKDLTSVNKEDIRAFLQAIKPKVSSSYYANHVKTFRVFFRDFLNVSWSADFKIPQPEFNSKWIPSKAELKQFYEALPSLKEKCLFLL